MAQDIALCKAEGEQWGFRLTGGTDFGTPLTVIKVTKAGVAERAGLHAGDMLMMLNDDPLTEMSHAEATDFIVKAGNEFRITVIRGSFILPPPSAPQNVDFPHELPATNPQEEGIQGLRLDGEPIREQGTTNTEQEEESAVLQIAIVEEKTVESSDPVVITEVPEDHGVQCEEGKVEEHVEYTEEEFAEMMSGCAEVLQERCLGVDFQKLAPDANLNSDVLNQILDDEHGKPQKKLSTFNQRPKRPRVKPKTEPAVPPPPYNPLKYRGAKKEEEARLEAERSEEALAAATAKRETIIPAEGEESEPQIHPEGEFEETEGNNTNEFEQSTDHEVEQSTDLEVEQFTDLEVEQFTDHKVIKDVIEEPNTIPAEKVVEEPTVDIEGQISEIQQQLAAIIQLPVEIQQHLSFIQQQLAKILQLKAAAAVEEKKETTEKAPAEVGDEPMETGDDAPEGVADQDREEQEEMDREVESIAMLTSPVPEVVVATPEPEVIPLKKDIQWRSPEQSEKKKSFYPLTPHPRPIRLPGGRVWQAPQDVYTEDFIAETLSGNEEVIMGTTIGGAKKPKKLKFHLSWSISPSVDFHKFDRNYDHLENSYVYRMIHEYEDSRKREPGSFAGRAGKALAKEDYAGGNSLPTSRPTSRPSTPIKFAVDLKRSASPARFQSPSPARFM